MKVSSKQKIELCLNCPYPKCINCIGNNKVTIRLSHKQLEPLKEENTDDFSAKKEDNEQIPFLEKAKCFGPSSSYGNLVIYRLWTLGYTDVEIAEEMSCLKPSVFLVRKSLGLPAPRGVPSKSRRIACVRNWMDECKDKMISLEKQFSLTCMSCDENETDESVYETADIPWKYKIRKTNVNDVYLTTAIYSMWKKGLFDSDMSRILYRNCKGIEKVRHLMGLPTPPRYCARLVRVAFADEFLTNSPEIRTKYDQLEMKLKRGETP